MAEKTLIDLLPESGQTADSITINKAALAAKLAAKGYTFTPAVNNSIEEIFIAFFCSGLIEFTEAAREEDPLARNLVMRYSPQNFNVVTDLEGNSVGQHLIECLLNDRFTIPAINPSDYRD